MKKRRLDRYIQRIENLLRLSLRGGESEVAWKAIRSLQFAGNQMIFKRATSWCASGQPFRRMRGANILAQLREGARRKPHSWGQPYRYADSAALISGLLEVETNIDAMDSEIIALMHLDNVISVPLIASFAQYENDRIRYAVTRALGRFNNHPLAVETLTKLMEDPDREVRDWAIFGVGAQGDSDSEELRNIFFEHLSDSYYDARLEATVSLAKRRDLRVVQPVINQLRKYGDINSLCEAAEYLLNMDSRPDPLWTAEEYVNALQSAFPTAN